MPKERAVVYYRIIAKCTCHPNIYGFGYSQRSALADLEMKIDNDAKVAAEFGVDTPRHEYD